MPKVIFGNHSTVRVRRAERERIRAYYRDVLGCKITRELDEDDLRMGDNYFILFLYEKGDVGSFFVTLGRQSSNGANTHRPSRGGSRMSYRMVAFHYAKKEFTDQMLQRLFRAAEIMKAAPGCLDVEVWKEQTSGALVSTAKFDLPRLLQEGAQPSFRPPKCGRRDFLHVWRSSAFLPAYLLAHNYSMRPAFRKTCGSAQANPK